MRTPGVARERSVRRIPERAPTARSERIYRLLLRAYPAAFRAAYEREMTLLFRDQRRDAGSSTPFWAGILWDVVRSAPPAHAERFRARRAAHNQSGERLMRPMSILAMLVGTVDVVNALIEGKAGWSSQGGLAWLTSLSAAVVAGVILVMTGIALMRRTPSSVAFARASAFACLALVAGAFFLSPWMSIFARLIGFTFPIVLMLSLRSAGRQGPAAPLTS